jgi:hypothetical protein
MRLDFFQGLSDQELRAHMLAALADAQRISPPPALISYSLLVYRLLLIVRKDIPGHEAGDVSKRLVSAQRDYSGDGGGEQPDNFRVLSTLWTLIGEGLLYPRMLPARDWPIEIAAVGITEKGRRVLAGSSAHPLHPAYLQRLRAGGLAVSIIARIEDATQCLERRLLRAAVVMTGLAFEEAIELCLDVAVQNAWLTTIPSKAVKRISELERVLPRIVGDEQRHRARLALVAAESIRTERNRASHPSDEFDDDLLVESLITETGIHVPRLCGAFGVAPTPASP